MFRSRVSSLVKRSHFLSSSSRNYTYNSSIHELVAAMKTAGVSRGYIVSDESGNPVVSHPVFEPIADYLRNDKINYKAHEGIFLGISPNTGELMSAFLWKTKRGQAAGGIRLKEYNEVGHFVKDGLRLAIDMGRKSSLAGLWWGGGKGVIPVPDSVPQPKRRQLFKDYGDFLTSLRGCFVAAEDSGITVSDMDMVFRRTRFTTCISPQLGGSGSPANPTAMGVRAAMEGALFQLDGSTLEGKTVAVQGLGRVGTALVQHLLAAGVKRVIASDINPRRVADIEKLYEVPRGFVREKVRTIFRVEDPNGPIEKSILAEKCDIFSPCGYGGIIDADSVKHIKAKIVCGGANNQLVDPRTDYGMQESGIIFVPDFVCNRMGIVNCSNEQYGSVAKLGSCQDPIVARHLDRDWEHSIFRVTQTLIKEAARRGVSTGTVACELADKYTEELHPLFGHRSADIIRSLQHDGWASK